MWYRDEKKERWRESKRPPAPDAGAMGNWHDRENWQKLHRGMTAEEVRGLLGKPDHAEVGSKLVQWRYGLASRVAARNR